MSALALGLRLAALAVPLLAYVLVLRWAGRRVGYAVLTGALGGALFVPGRLFEAWLLRFAGLDESPRGTAEIAALVYAFLVAAPLEQGLKVAAIAPVWRSRSFDEPIDGVVYAAAAALGFVTAHNAAYLFGIAPLGFDPIVRALAVVPAHMFFASTWGYALALDPRKRLGGRAFNVTWLVAMLFNGVYDRLAFALSFSAVLATIPILFCMAFAAWIGGRDLLEREVAPASRPSRPRRFLPAIAPPSIQAVRAALRRTERPVMFHWIGFGALVTTGVMTATLAGAVAFGHRVGVDFAAVDRGDAAGAGAAPLVILGAGALAAFPIAGYLVARASAARSVLEPAIAAGLAIAGALVLLGLAAPVAVVFAIAFAPVAFALACAGAWVGMSR